MRLVVEGDALADQDVQVRQAQSVIGRDTTNDIVLAEHAVSRQHARIHYTPGAPGAVGTWYLIDLGTTNGTLLNGSRLPAHQPRPLQPGDRVSIGGAVLVVRDVAPPAGQAPGSRDRAGIDEGPLMRLPVALRALAALLYVGALIAIVALLVALLQPEPRAEEAVMPPAENPLDVLMTAIPTGLPEELTAPLEAIETALPTGVIEELQEPIDAILTSLPVSGTPRP